MTTNNPLSEQQRQELLSELVAAHDSVCQAAAKIRRGYSAKSSVAKVAAKAEQSLFRLKRELERAGVPQTPAGLTLPEIHRAAARSWTSRN